MTKEERAKRDKKLARENERIRKALPKLVERLEDVEESRRVLDLAGAGDFIDRKEFTKLQARLHYADKALDRILKIIQG